MPARLASKAIAAGFGGGALPVRFGTWFWGCGMIPRAGVPKTAGANYDLPPQLAPLQSVQQHINILSGFNVDLSAKNNQPHISGGAGALRTGAPSDSEAKIAAPSFDVSPTRSVRVRIFRSLELTANGNPRTAYSYRNEHRHVRLDTFGDGDVYPNFRRGFSRSQRRDVHAGPEGHGPAECFVERVGAAQAAGAADRRGGRRQQTINASLREVEQKLALQLQETASAGLFNTQSPCGSAGWH